MKKIMILGLMLAMSACSNEPDINMGNLVRDILFESIKKSYIAYGGTTTILQNSGGDFSGITSVGATTIDALNFSMPVNNSEEKVEFEYIEVLDDAWLVYKATYKNTVRYTAFMSAGKDGNSLMIEAISTTGKFRENQADIDPTTLFGSYVGSEFLRPPTRQNSQDSSIIEMTVTKVSN